MEGCFKKTVEKTCLNVVELNMILTEIETTLNSHLRHPYVYINKATPPIDHIKTVENEVHPDYVLSQISVKELAKRAKYYKKVIQAIGT